MEQYITRQEFKDWSSADYSDSQLINFNNHVLVACIRINNLSGNTIEKLTFDKLSDKQKEAVKQCCFILLTFYTELGYNWANSSSSISTDGISESQSALSEPNWIQVEINLLLQSVNLHNPFEAVNTTNLIDNNTNPYLTNFPLVSATYTTYDYIIGAYIPYFNFTSSDNTILITTSINNKQEKVLDLKLNANDTNSYILGQNFLSNDNSISLTIGENEGGEKTLNIENPQKIDDFVKYTNFINTDATMTIQSSLNPSNEHVLTFSAVQQSLIYFVDYDKFISTDNSITITKTIVDSKHILDFSTAGTDTSKFVEYTEFKPLDETISITNTLDSTKHVVNIKANIPGETIPTLSTFDASKITHPDTNSAQIELDLKYFKDLTIKLSGFLVISDTYSLQGSTYFKIDNTDQINPSMRMYNALWDSSAADNNPSALYECYIVLLSTQHPDTNNRYITIRLFKKDRATDLLQPLSLYTISATYLGEPIS